MTLSDPYKVDLAFTDDFQVTPTGDLDTVSGLTNVRGAILRRIITAPGSLVHRPTYGCGLVLFQNAPMTLGARRQIASRIAQQLPEDPRIEKVRSVSVSAASDSAPESVKVTVEVDVVGIGATTFEFTPFSEVVV